jgi:hypothetical protein
MPAAIFNGANVKILKDRLKGKSGWTIIGSGTYSYSLPTLSTDDTIVTQLTPTFDAVLNMKDATTPGTTAADYNNLYFKSDDKLYQRNEAGTEKLVGSPYLGTDFIIRTNAQTISENITIPSTTNGMTAGPITIASTYTVTVSGNWSIV